MARSGGANALRPRHRVPSGSCGSRSTTLSQWRKLHICEELSWKFDCTFFIFEFVTLGEIRNAAFLLYLFLFLLGRSQWCGSRTSSTSRHLPAWHKITGGWRNSRSPNWSSANGFVWSENYSLTIIHFETCSHYFRNFFLIKNFRNVFWFCIFNLSISERQLRPILNH